MADHRLYVLCAAFASAGCVSMRAPVEGAFDHSAARVARGDYVVNHLADCVTCHSQRQADKYGMPVTPGSEGAGGPTFDSSAGFPGKVIPPNITPDRETGVS